MSLRYDAKKRGKCDNLKIKTRQHLEKNADVLLLTSPQKNAGFMIIAMPPIPTIIFSKTHAAGTSSGYVGLCSCTRAEYTRCWPQGRVFVKKSKPTGLAQVQKMLTPSIPTLSLNGNRLYGLPAFGGYARLPPERYCPNPSSLKSLNFPVARREESFSGPWISSTDLGVESRPQILGAKRDSLQ